MKLLFFFLYFRNSGGEKIRNQYLQQSENRNKKNNQTNKLNDFYIDDSLSNPLDKSSSSLSSASFSSSSSSSTSTSTSPSLNYPTHSFRLKLKPNLTINNSFVVPKSPVSSTTNVIHNINNNNNNLMYSQTPSNLTKPVSEKLIKRNNFFLNDNKIKVEILSLKSPTVEKKCNLTPFKYNNSSHIDNNNNEDEIKKVLVLLVY
jgi:hypothetical protein